MRIRKLELSGYGPFSEPSEIHFEDLNFFCITGRNGSGKSTIIDAISFALWGQSLKTGEREQLFHKHVSKGYVYLNFEMHDKIFEIQRKFEKKSQKESQGKGSWKITSELFIKDKEKGLEIEKAISAKEMKHWIEDVLMLKQDILAQTLIVSQASLQGILKMGKVEDREPLLKFYTYGFFDSMRESLKKDIEEYEREYQKLPWRYPDKTEKDIEENILVLKEKIDLAEQVLKEVDIWNQKRIEYTSYQKEIQRNLQEAKAYRHKIQEVAIAEKEYYQHTQVYSPEYQEEMEKKWIRWKEGLPLLQMWHNEISQNHLYYRLEEFYQKDAPVIQDKESTLKKEKHSLEQWTQKREMLHKQKEMIQVDEDISKEEIHDRQERIKVLQSILEQKGQKEKVLQSIQAQLQDIQASVQILQQKQAKEREKVEHLAEDEKQYLLHRLLQHHREGDPCPICGNTWDYSHLEEGKNPDGETIQAEMKKIQASIERTQKQIQEKQLLFERENTKKEILIQELATLEEAKTEIQSESWCLKRDVADHSVLDSLQYWKNYELQLAKWYAAIEKKEKVAQEIAQTQEEIQKTQEKIQMAKESYDTYLRTFQGHLDAFSEWIHGILQISQQTETSESLFSLEIEQSLQDVLSQLESAKKKEDIAPALKILKASQERVESIFVKIREQYKQLKKEYEQYQHLVEAQRQQLESFRKEKQQLELLLVKNTNPHLLRYLESIVTLLEQDPPLSEEEKALREKLYAEHRVFQELLRDKTLFCEAFREHLSQKEVMDHLDLLDYTGLRYLDRIKEKLENAQEENAILEKEKNIWLQEIAYSETEKETHQKKKQLEAVLREIKPLILAFEKDQFPLMFFRKLMKIWIRTANDIYLSKVLEGRYSLVIREEKYIYIQDQQLVNSDGGLAERNIETLSNGEMFLVTLSCALAFTHLIQSKVGIFFLDEGFGSLDHENRDFMREFLAQIKEIEEGRQFGIITHVPEISDMFQERIHIEVDSTGKHTISQTNTG